jgi:hypothetical protein
VYFSYDQTGLFGAPGASLDGATFTATYRYDTTQGTTDDGGYYRYLYGGTAYGVPSPIFYAALTINGVTQTLDLNYYAFIDRSETNLVGGTNTQAGHNAQDSSYDGAILDDDYFYALLGSVDDSLAIPLDLTQAFTAELDPSNFNHYWGGRFSFTDRTNTMVYTENTYGYLLTTKVAVTTISAVPLPAGGLLLIGGLGALALLRRRRAA